MKSSITQTRPSAESLTNRVEQGENRISELEDKLEELEHSDKEKNLRKYE
jgi:DNA/RNA-binding domain of Phe-tRNA-synthetase-like protein